LGGECEASGGLADAFHNLPKDMWTENFSLEDYHETFLKAYLEKYTEQSNCNYFAMINYIILMGNPDYSAN
jgi:aminoglycoside phosphotransferase